MQLATKKILIQFNKKILQITFTNYNPMNIRVNNKPWLVWVGGLSTSLQTKESLVQFPVRARAWVAGQVPQ